MLKRKKEIRPEGELPKKYGVFLLPFFLSLTNERPNRSPSFYHPIFGLTILSLSNYLFSLKIKNI
jgi:hypothetical protein